jgi:hypothetical protein
VAEQFGFEKIFGNGRAIERNERLVGARTLAVNIARKDFLPVPDSPVIRMEASEGAI